ncbi:MAG: LysM peptidoglycan-binding domain-containing protein [Deltaproteobacteria bacterium]|nr:LysM peptidoglycan-binding domain-containing protein [Candidatus Zymogenaceae bacterium]
MGLFEFVKSAGEAILNQKNPNSGDVENHIKDGLGGAVKDIAVDLIGNMIKLKGNVDSNDLLEKAILLAGNIKGVEKVDTSGLNVAGAPVGGQQQMGTKPGGGASGPGESTFYTIVKGDTLSGIAKKFYGDGNKYHQIFEANRGIIKNADLIYPGQTIRIPKV